MFDLDQAILGWRRQLIAIAIGFAAAIAAVVPADMPRTQRLPCISLAWLLGNVPDPP